MRKRVRLDRTNKLYGSCDLMRIGSFLDTVKDVPITWPAEHMMRISLVVALSLDSSWSVVRHTNAWSVDS